jgi:hypothetical protein
MTDYLDNVCAAIRGGELRRAARSELVDHMRERYDWFIAEGKEPEAAALETIKRMGDPELLGQRISKANHSGKGIFFGLIGLVVFIIASLFVIGIHGHFDWFIQPFEFFIVAVLSAACGFLFCGFRFDLTKFIIGIKFGALYAGGMLFVVGIICMLYGMAPTPEGIGDAMATAMISLYYGTLISLAAKIAEGKSGKIRGLVD